ARAVADSAVAEHLYKVFPNDPNAYNTMFGGAILATIDRLASIVAERHAGRVCVTASVDAVHFMAPARHGDTLMFSAAVNRAWGTSMEIGARVVAEDIERQDQRHIVSAYLTFVALDENNKPTAVPAVTPKTEAEKQRYEEADIRRSQRLRHAEAIKNFRESGVRSVPG
ncbi:MAG: acyl-CoA thioesterase, partial [Salinisphaeraceae bacterium]|nr:acyl-CoA thioesterase [Salinisphaeraceae bacterium]